MKKRILSILIILSMLLCMVPAVSGEYAEPDIVVYSVQGGALIFDKASGVVVGSQIFGPEVVVPAEIQGVPVKEIGAFSFERKANLTSVTLPDTISLIGGYAFNECGSLAHINIPDSVTAIAGYAFWGCMALEEIHLPETLQEIDESTFVDCQSLKELVIPDSVVRIGSYAFCGCSGLRTVTIPRNVTEIGPYAFSSCGSLERFAVAPGNTAFSADEQGVLYSVDGMLLKQVPGGISGQFTVASEVKVIGEAAFDGCFGLTGVTIPSGVTSIQHSAFYGCEGLTELVLPASVGKIDTAAFGVCKNLSKIELPEGVTSIGAGVFLSCDALKGVTLPASLKELDPNAFEGSSLISIVFRGTREQWNQAAGFDLDIPVLFNIPQKDLPHYEAGCSSARFGDVPPVNDWAHEGIDFCVKYDFMNGVADTVFNPNGTVSRAQLVTILYRVDGAYGGYYWNPFTDVPPDMWYSNAVAWAAMHDIVEGVGGGRFNPSGAVTREQIATILYRYAGWPSVSGSLAGFPDAGSVSDYARQAMIWATSEGLINGVKSGDAAYLRPQANATRSQIAAIIMRYLTNDRKEDGEGTSVRFWTFQEIHAAFYEEMALEWNRKYPDRQINLIPTVYPFEDMHSRLGIALERGFGAPDMVDIEFGKFSSFLRDDIGLLPLNDVVEPELDSIVRSRVDIYSKDGNFYGIDYHVGAAMVFYNRELCQAAGINYGDIKTWDDYYNAAKKFKAAFPGKYWNSVESSDIWHLWGQLAELGADFTDENGNVTINTPEMARVLEYNRKMVREGLATVAPGTYHHAEEFYTMMDFGNIASIVMPFWYIDRFTNYMPDLAGKIVTAPLPVWEPGEKRSVGQGGTATSVTDQADDPRLVKDFLAFCKLSRDGGVKAWTMIGYDPINTGVWSMEDVTHDSSNTFVQYYANNPFDTLLQIKDEIAGLNNNEALPIVLDTMKAGVLYRAYETSEPIAVILAEEQALAEDEAMWSYQWN